MRKSDDILHVCSSAMHHYLQISTFAQHWINGKVIMEVTQGELSPSPQECQMGDHLMPWAAASSHILCWIGDIFCCICTVRFACVHLCLQQLKCCVYTLSGGSMHECVHVGVNGHVAERTAVKGVAWVMMVVHSWVCVWVREGVGKQCLLITPCLSVCKVLGAPGHVCTVHCFAPPVWQSVREAL